MVWTGPERAFAVETYIKNGESVITTQRAFRIHFGLNRNDAVPGRKSILLWTERFRTTGSALKKNPPGRPRSIRTPENVQAVRQYILQSPNRSARKHASALGLSDRTLRRILHSDLNFEPQKMVIKELHKYDSPSEGTASPNNVTDSPSKVTDSPSNVTDSPSNVTDSPNNVTDSLSNVTDSPSNEIDSRSDEKLKKPTTTVYID
ncbi:XP_033610977.1uncharacterized protein LOC117283012 [Octopus vulgaris]|uniref:XP_033610977.1uncharacterized protein LOC117283012 n=1 Tax=Octopus vulgaris TaxID=6645 RepID=A0AA36BRE3_OCTVU|nr:XP_033610977.1uncharacterized protein LOC117283012 [Octopus vulgaris]